MLPPEYARPGGYPYPYWPYHHTGPYAYPQEQDPSGSPRITEELSQKNTGGALPADGNGQGGSADLSNQNESDQAFLNGNDNGNNNGNDNADTANQDANLDNAQNWADTDHNQNAVAGDWNGQDNRRLYSCSIPCELILHPCRCCEDAGSDV